MFSSAVSVGIRLNCWKTNPNARRRSSARSASRSWARSRSSKTTRPLDGRSSAPSSCSSVVFPDPLGPSSARNSPGSMLRLDVLERVDDEGAAGERLADAGELELAHSTVLKASAGRSRAARRAPAAPASSPPRTARRKPPSRIGKPTGAESETASEVVRAACSTPKMVSRRGGGAGGERRPEAADEERRRDAERDAEDPSEHALGERLARDLADDLALRPAERLQRSQLADALADGRERKQRREQERGGCGDDREREPEAVREVGCVDERAADRPRDLLRARDLRLLVRGLDALLHRRDGGAVVGADEDDVDEILLAGELLQLCERAGRRRRPGRRAAGRRARRR